LAPQNKQAVEAVLNKYKEEPCLDSTVSEIQEAIRTRDEKNWGRDKELRAWLKGKLSKLLNAIHYWDFVIVQKVEIEDKPEELF
jgi:hypothetical protein